MTANHTTTAPASTFGPAHRRMSLVARVGEVARDIKLSHSVFALPFALLATFLAAAHAGRLPSLATILLIVLCMFFARTVAMTVNRLADARLDAGNPRTVGRALPAGRVSIRFMAVCALFCAAMFMLSAGGFWLLDANPWPLLLSPFVLAWLSIYSFTKRFTSLCHLFLGSALALSPIAAVIAVQPAYLNTFQPYLLALMVFCWVGGFDIIYALQDVEVDRTQGVYSMPARMGVEPALWISRSLHGISLLALVMLWRTSAVLNAGFGTGLMMMSALLLLEHTLVWRSRTHHINMAFLTINGVISLVLGALGIVDVVIHL